MVVELRESGAEHRGCGDCGIITIVIVWCAVLVFFRFILFWSCALFAKDEIRKLMEFEI